MATWPGLVVVVCERVLELPALGHGQARGESFSLFRSLFPFFKNGFII
jgi:hypothetical protein